jgi:hypothetical protein
MSATKAPEVAMTDTTDQDDFEGLSPEALKEKTMEEIFRWLRMGADPKSIAAKCRMSLKQLEYKLYLYPDLKADWDDAVADSELRNLEIIHEVLEDTATPAVARAKIARENLRRFVHHAPAQRPIELKHAGSLDLDEPEHEEMSQQQLDTIRERTEAKAK